MATQTSTDCQALLRDFDAGLALGLIEVFVMNHKRLLLVLRTPPPIATFTAPADVFGLSAYMDGPFLANELRGDFEVAMPIFFIPACPPTAAPRRFAPIGVVYRITGDFD